MLACERMSSREVNNLQMLNRILCKQMILIMYQEVAGQSICLHGANGCELSRADVCADVARERRHVSLPKVSLEVACYVCDA